MENRDYLIYHIHSKINCFEVLILTKKNPNIISSNSKLLLHKNKIKWRQIETLKRFKATFTVYNLLLVVNYQDNKIIPFLFQNNKKQ